jgi:hypothetical protein
VIVTEKGSDPGVDHMVHTSDDLFAFDTSRLLSRRQEFSVLETYARQRLRLWGGEGERRRRTYLNSPQDSSLYWLPVCQLPRRAGSPGTGVRYLSKDTQQKAHIGGCAEYRAERRETANSRADAAATVRFTGLRPSQCPLRAGFAGQSSEL